MHMIELIPVDCLDYFIIFFFFIDTATTEIYTLSLHDALPICPRSSGRLARAGSRIRRSRRRDGPGEIYGYRSEEHTSELQSRRDLVCRLLLEKKKIVTTNTSTTVY